MSISFLLSVTYLIPLLGKYTTGQPIRHDNTGLMFHLSPAERQMDSVFVPCKNALSLVDFPWNRIRLTRYIIFFVLDSICSRQIDNPRTPVEHL